MSHPELHQSLHDGFELDDQAISELHQDHLDYFKEHSNSPNGTPYVIEAHGETPGPHLAFGGGVHGNELSGVEASMKVHQKIQSGELKLKNGSLSFILGNPEAYQQVQRYLETNLNRIMTQDQLPNTIEGRRAKEIQDYIHSIRQSLSLIFDIHSVSRGDFTMGIYNRSNPANWRLIESLPPAFKYYFGYLNNHLDGIFSEMSTKLKIDGFSAECGNHVSPMAVDRALYYMKTACNHYGIEFEGEWPEISPIAVAKTKDPIHYHTIGKAVPCEGFEFSIPDITTGTQLAAGQVFAHVIRDGKIVEEKKAPSDCKIVMPPAKVDADDVDAGFFCIEV